MTIMEFFLIFKINFKYINPSLLSSGYFPRSSLSIFFSLIHLNAPVGRY